MNSRKLLSLNVNMLLDLHEGMTITSLAVKAGLPRQTIYNVLDERGSVTLTTLDKLASAFGCYSSNLLEDPLDPNLP